MSHGDSSRHLDLEFLSGDKFGMINKDSSLINETEWLTTAEAAEFLRLPIGTFRNLCSNGSIPFYKVPGTRLNRYSKTELQGLLLAQKRGGSNGN